MGAFADEAALELCKRGKQVEDQPATRRGGVQRFGQADQGHAALLQVLYDVNEMTQAAAEPVQPPDDQAVARSGALQCARETRAVR